MKNLVIILLLVFYLPIVQAQTITLHVSPNGDDANEGNPSAPLASINGALAKFELLHRSAYDTVVIELEDGIYYTSPISVSTKWNGIKHAKVVIRAKNQGKAILNTGKVLELLSFTAVGPPFSERVRAHLTDSIVSIKISDFGIANVRRYADIFNGNGDIPQLFFERKRMPLAQYPNPGEDKMTIKEVLVNGGGQEKPGSWSDFYLSSEVRKQLEIHPPRPGVFTFRSEHQDAHQRWAKALEQGIPVWLNGFWRVMWQNSSIRVGEIALDSMKVKLAVPLKEGIGSKYHRPGGSGEEIYQVVNLLEEIDAPGEWSFDFASQRIFFYPPKEYKEGNVMIAHESSPVIHLKYVSNVTLEGLVIEGGLGDGIEITGGQNNAVLGCTIRHIGNDGVKVDGGFEHEVRSSDLYDLGGGGVWLAGGMEETTPRVAAKHRVVNNHIHHFAKVRKVYAAGINCGFEGGGGGGHYPAVGMYVAHNLVHTTPHVGMLHGSFDNVFEYNEVLDWSRVSNDMGALYCYSHYPHIDNTTVRYNFFHSSAEGDGVYFDHNMKGAKIYGNVLYHLGTEGPGRGTAYLLKNGHLDLDKDPFQCYNNIVVESKIGYFARLSEKEGFYNNIAVKSIEKPYEVLYYPELGAEPVRNPAFVNENNWTYEKDPGFVDMKSMNFNLKRNSRIFKDIPGFEPIPFDKIGLYVDQYRKTVNYDHRDPDYLKKFGTIEAYEVMDRD